MWRMLTILALIIPCDSFKFLAYSPQFESSHVHFMGVLSDLLIDAGHEVVRLAPQMNTLMGKTGTQKLRMIEIPQASRVFEEYINNKLVKNMWSESDVFKMLEGSEVFIEAHVAQCNGKFEFPAAIPSHPNGLTAATLHHPGLTDQLREEKFDVGFSESIDFCSVGLFHLVGIDKFAITESLAMVDGQFSYSQIPASPSYVPSMMSGFAGDQMSFFERMSNFLTSYITGIAKESFLCQWEAVFKAYRPDFPRLKELVAQNSLVFMNSDPLIDFPRPSAARIIDIGGISVSNGSKALNETWSAIMDLRPRTVLISFGSFAYAHLMPEAYKKSIVAAAKSRPDVTFIFKYEIPEHTISMGVDNLIETTWMPQNDILHDSRLSAFITHGGPGSMTEAYYAGVPLIVIPICFDQLRNAAQVRKNGVGLVVEKTDLVDERRLEEAIEEILTNEQYRTQAKKIQHMLRDRPFKMSEVFVRNMEFLAKHGPLRQLDHFGRHLTVLQYYLIDVIASIAVAAFVLMFITMMIVRSFARHLLGALVREKPKRE